MRTTKWFQHISFARNLLYHVFNMWPRLRTPALYCFVCLSENDCNIIDVLNLIRCYWNLRLKYFTPVCVFVIFWQSGRIQMTADDSTKKSILDFYYISREAGHHWSKSWFLPARSFPVSGQWIEQELNTWRFSRTKVSSFLIAFTAIRSCISILPYL